MDQTRQLLLHRYAIKPGHLATGLELWRREVGLYQRFGFTSHRAVVETDAEPKLSWLYSVRRDRLEQALADLALSPDYEELSELKLPHCFRNTMVRPVEPEVLTEATPESVRGTGERERIAIMRRYDLTGDWSGFLEVWRRVREVREAHDFHCLFAVCDLPRNQFTWAFDFDGDFADFPAAQRDYYHDPQRVALRGVFDHMADYSIHPARQLLLREPDLAVGHRGVG